MSYFFIIPIAVAVGCMCIFKKTANEMAYLAASVSGVSLVLGLVLAPWQIQLLLVITLLLSYKVLNLPIER